MNLSLTAREISRLLPNAKLRRQFFQAADQENGPGQTYSPRQVKKGFQALGRQYRPQTMAFINLKGGVGKTTSSLALAARAAQYGHRVALLDLDSQASATLALGARVDRETPIFLDIWNQAREAAAASLHRLHEQLYLLPSSLENGLLESSLAAPAAQKNAVAGVTAALAENGFDLMVVDCPPSLGTAVISTICAVDRIIIPISCDDFSYRGMELTLGEVNSICDTFCLQPPKISVLPTGVDKRIKLWEQLRRRLESEHPGLALPLYIRTSSAFSKALAQRRGIFEPGTAAGNARDDYDRFVRLILGLEF